jgi:hypothetical protein
MPAAEVHGARARDARSAVSAQVPGWMTPLAQAAITARERTGGNTGTAPAVYLTTMIMSSCTWPWPGLS